LKIDIHVSPFSILPDTTSPTSLRAVFKIALISPKGPLLSASWRYLEEITALSNRSRSTTLAALIPNDWPVSVQLIDEGIADVPLDLDGDLVA